jgi:hypothetical protein
MTCAPLHQASCTAMLPTRDKPDEERGYYIHPDLYTQSEERGINHLLKEERKRVTSYKKYHIQNGLSHTLRK